MNEAARLKMIDSGLNISIRRQCELLDLSRGRYYYQPKAESDLNVYLMKLIDMQYLRTPFYGVPRMTDYINDSYGFKINRKRVYRLYKIMDIKALGPNPYTSKSDPLAASSIVKFHRINCS